MPDSPHEDPFADLFGKLPDPRSRELGTPQPAASAQPTAPAPASPSMPAAATDGAPLSRRAAREAAERAATGATDVDPAPAPAPASPAAPAVPAVSAAAAAAAAQAAQAEQAAEAAHAAQAAAAAETARAADIARSPQASATEAPGAWNPFDDLVEDTAAETAPAAAPGATENDVDPAEAWRATQSRRSAEPADTAPPSYSRTGAIPTATERAAAPAATSPDLADLFSGAHSTDDIGFVPPAPNKRKRRIGGWIALGVVVAILGGITAGGFYVWNTYEDKIREFMGWEEPKDYEDGMATGEALVTISSGDIPSTISQSLYDAGVTKTPEAFYDMLIDTSQNPTFYPGVYTLQQQMTSEAALAALQDPANKVENSALLREGLTVEQSLPILAESLGLPLEDFQAAVADPTVYGVPVDPEVVAAGGQPLEGWLFPAMYTFDPGVTAKDVIARLVEETISRLDAAGVAVEDRQTILNKASIIQREARYEADMQKVARVIENRLNAENQETYGLLQMDSTAQYGYGEMHDGTASTSEEAQFDDNPWNTYVVTGLPVGPIANPGETAITAAMNPADGDWLYFVTVNLDTGETVFTSNLADHNRAVEQWQSWCRDNPDSGC